MKTVITKDKLRSMNEEKLREHLMELYSRMGFQGIEHYHGSQELGKDILMWRIENGNRVNYASLVKSGKISGGADIKKGTSGNILMQVFECFGIAAITEKLQDFPIDKVYIVCNGPFKTPARNALRSALLGSGKADSVEFFGLESIWELTKEHFSVSAVTGQLLAKYNELNSSNEFYSFDITSVGGRHRIKIREKFPGAAKMDPVAFHLSTRFDDSIEGKNRSLKYQQALQGETDFVLKKEEIAKFEVSGSLKELLEMELDSLEIRPAEIQLADFTGYLAIRDNDDDTNNGILEGLHFEVVRKGKHIVIKTRDSKFDIKFRLELSTVQDNEMFSISGRFSFSFDRTGKTPKLFRDWLCFLEAWQEGRSVYLEDYERGVFFESPISSPLETTPEPVLVDFARSLFRLSKKLKLPILVSDKITATDAENLADILAMLESKATADNIALNVELRGVDAFLDLVNKPAELCIWTDIEKVVMGTKISLPALIVGTEIRVSANEIERVRKLAHSDSPPAIIIVQSIGKNPIYIKGWSEKYFEESNNEIGPPISKALLQEGA